MNTLQFFLEHHHRLYFLTGGLFDRLKDLTDGQMRICPNYQNSIAWLVWHMARCEDVGINRLVTDKQQIINRDGWYQKLNLTRKDIGTGMKEKEVNQLSSKINVEQLKAYSKLVAIKTEEVISNLNEHVLDEILPTEYISKILYDEYVVDEKDTSVLQVYKNKSRGWFLGHLGLTHAKGHLSQILIIRKLQGLGSGE